MIGFEGSRTLNVLNSVLLEQELNTVGQTTNLTIINAKNEYSLFLGLHDTLKIIADILADNTVLFHDTLSFLVHQRGVKKSLGGNATNIQASTTQSTSLFNTSSLQTELSSLNSGNITTGTTTNNDNIKPKKSRQSTDIVLIGSGSAEISGSKNSSLSNSSRTRKREHSKKS